MALGAITWRIFELITPEHGLSYVQLRHKATTWPRRIWRCDVWLTKACRSNLFAQRFLNLDAGKGKKKMLYVFRDGSLDALASKTMMGIVVLAKTMLCSCLQRCTSCRNAPLHSPGEPLDLNPDLVMVEEDRLVDGEEEDDEEYAAAGQDDAARGGGCPSLCPTLQGQEGGGDRSPREEGWQFLAWH